MASTKVQTSESAGEQRWRRRVLARKLCVTQLFLQSNLLLNWHTKPPWLMYGALKTLWELSWVYHLSYRVSNQHVFKLLEVMLSVMTPCFRRVSILHPEKIGVERSTFTFTRVFFTQLLIVWLKHRVWILLPLLSNDCVDATNQQFGPGFLRPFVFFTVSMSIVCCSFIRSQFLSCLAFIPHDYSHSLCPDLLGVAFVQILHVVNVFNSRPFESYNP